MEIGTFSFYELLKNRIVLFLYLIIQSHAKTFTFLMPFSSPN